MSYRLSRRSAVAAAIAGFGASGLCQNAMAFFRHRRLSRSVPTCYTPGQATNQSIIERGLDATAGRPGVENLGQQILRDVDNRPKGKRALSIHLGVNWVDPRHYGEVSPLNACLYDAQRMRQLAEKMGFVTSMMTNTYATTESLLKYLRAQAQQLSDGDMLFITYAGHGSNITDTSGDESDRLDETWCLHDRMLIDDELWHTFAEFEPGVRILFVLDSCHSGSAIRSMQKARTLRSRDQQSYRSTFGSNASAVEKTLRYLTGTDAQGLQATVRRSLDELRTDSEVRIRTLRQAEADQIYVQNEMLYRSIKEKIPPENKIQIGASVLLLAACQDGQVAQEAGASGLFTLALTQTVEPLATQGLLFDGTYDAFLIAVKQRMAGVTKQTPELFKDGDLTTLFRNERPFDLERRLPPTLV